MLVSVLKCLFMAVVCLILAAIIILGLYIITLFAVCAYQKITEEVRKNGGNE